MKKLCAFMLAVMFFFTGDILARETDCKETVDQAYCNLKKPPKEAYPLESHGFYAFSYPRILPDHFSGCHTVWDEQGRKMQVTRFENSKPIVQELYREDSTSVICEVREKDYEKEGQICLNAESVKRGVKAMLPTKPDPRVPAKRDPRESKPG